MTMSFPLLKLPLIPLEVIIEPLDFLDLLQLSMKSTKFKRFLELLKMSVRFLNVRFIENSYEVSIRRNSTLSYINVCGRVPVDTITEAVKMEGEPVQIWKDGSNELNVKSDSAKMATLEAITKHVLSFSKVIKFYATFKSLRTEIRSLFIWQLTTQLNEFDILSNHGSHVPISPEDLTFLLDGISIKCLSLNVSCPGLKYQRPIRHPVINIRRSNWIDFDQLSLGPETVTANFYEQKVSNAVLNRLMKDWTEGKNPKLRAVKFEWEEYDRESLAMAREHETRPPKPVLPNRNIKQLKGLCINFSITYRFWSQSVYTAKLSVEKDLGLNGIHLEDQV